MSTDRKGAICNDAALLEIANSILNAGDVGENIFNDGGTITSLGYNLSSDNGGGYLSGPGDQTNTDPILGPLQNNGGPTQTHRPYPQSPAIDAGDPSFYAASSLPDAYAYPVSDANTQTYPYTKAPADSAPAPVVWSPNPATAGKESVAVMCTLQKAWSFSRRSPEL